MTKLIRGIFITAILVLVFSACSSPAGGGNTSFTITLDANGGTFDSGETSITVEINKGSALSSPSTPTYGIFSFGGWATEAKGGVLFTSPVQFNQTLYARWVLDLDDIESYLTTQSGTASDPIYLPVYCDLGYMPSPSSNWYKLLNFIQSKGKYVDLDLSNCTMVGDVFDPDYTFTLGKRFIVSLILPESADSIVDGTHFSNSAFINFDELTSVSAVKLRKTGDYAFFTPNLKSVNFPEVIIIGNSAFIECFGLMRADIPKATSIGNGAFSNCYSLESVNFPNVTTIGSGAIWGCYGFQSLDFPKVTSIGNGAFFGCGNLQKINLPMVTTIGTAAFISTGTTPLEITLGNTAPSVGVFIFEMDYQTKLVTVIVPANATGYGETPQNITDLNWGNAFRGIGWDGTNYLGGLVDEYIDLRIEKK